MRVGSPLQALAESANIIIILDFKLFYRGFLLPPAHQFHYGAGETLVSLWKCRYGYIKHFCHTYEIPVEPEDGRG